MPENLVVDCVRCVFLGLAAWVWWIMPSCIKSIGLGLNDHEQGGSFSQSPQSTFHLSKHEVSWLWTLLCLRCRTCSVPRRLCFGILMGYILPLPPILFPIWLQLLTDALRFNHNLGHFLGLSCTHHYCHGAGVNHSLGKPEKSKNSFGRIRSFWFLDQLWNNHPKGSRKSGITMTTLNGPFLAWLETYILGRLHSELGGEGG